jgi:hypothetical protein
MNSFTCPSLIIVIPAQAGTLLLTAQCVLKWGPRLRGDDGLWELIE